jgi:hypothetical protein
MTLTEKYCCSNFDILRTVHVTESDCAFVTSSKQVFIHVNDLRCLPDNTTVDDSLIVWFDCCGVVKYDNFGVEVEYRLGLCIFVNKNASFAEVGTLKLILLDQRLYVKTDSLTSECSVNLNSLVVDSADLDWLKDASLVGSKLKGSTGSYCSSEKCACNNKANTCHHINAINEELYWVGRRTEVATCVHSTFNQGKKLSELRNTFTRDIRNTKYWAHLHRGHCFCEQ